MEEYYSIQSLGSFRRAVFSDEIAMFLDFGLIELDIFF